MPRIDDLLLQAWRSESTSRNWTCRQDITRFGWSRQDRAKTAFRIAEPIDGHCLFEWKVMPFGLKNAPSYVSTLYDAWSWRSVLSCCLVYMDDLLVYSATPEQHLQDLEKVFHILSRKLNLRSRRRSACLGPPV